MSEQHEYQIRVERREGTDWNVYVTEGTEWGPDEKLWDTVDDCETEAEALRAARRLLEERWGAGCGG